MTSVEVFVDPSCPWAWVTSRWVRDVAPRRDLVVSWRSYCLEIRDGGDVAATVPEAYRQQALDGHALSHRMLRIWEAARVEAGDDIVDRLYTEWGARFFAAERPAPELLLSESVAAAGLDPGLVAAADNEEWDVPIRAAMDVAYAFAGRETQTSAIVVRSDPPQGFKGPVMADAPTGPGAVQLWDAIQVLTQHEGFFEITRPRTRSPRPHLPG